MADFNLYVDLVLDEFLDEYECDLQSKTIEMADFNLPKEIWCQIFTYLPLASKKNATATCKLWSKLIREDQKLSGRILISWFNMKTALETSQWNWSNWPVLKTLELNKLKLVEDLRDSIQHPIQNVIEKLSLKDHCPASLEEVLFNVSPIQTKIKSPLVYQPHTDKIFGLGQELSSTQKWIDYESNAKALIRLESLREPAGTRWPVEPPAVLIQLGQKILAELAPDSSDDLLLLIASPSFQTFRRLCDEYIIVDPHPMPHPVVRNLQFIASTNPDLVQYMELDEFLDEYECNMK